MDQEHAGVNRVALEPSVNPLTLHRPHLGRRKIEDLTLRGNSPGNQM